jgi:hypothetical protein
MLLVRNKKLFALLIQYSCPSHFLTVNEEHSIDKNHIGLYI